VRLRETVTPQMRSCLNVWQDMPFQVTTKTLRLDGRIAQPSQRIRQWVPNHRTGNWESL